MMSLQVQMEEEEQEGSRRKGDDGLGFLVDRKVSIWLGLLDLLLLLP
jgi:hypothetical protein